MFKVVFDTVVFVRSLINPAGVPGRLVFDYADSYRLFTSPPVLVEILEVLHRSHLRRKFRTLVGADIDWVLACLEQAEVVQISKVPSVSRDPKDDKFLATAHEAQADYVVTEDTDLLDLKEYHGIKIITALEFLHILDEKKL